MALQLHITKSTCHYVVLISIAFSLRYRKNGNPPANPSSIVSSHTSQILLMPCLFASMKVHTKKTKTAKSKSIIKMVEIRLANIPSMVAIGFVYRRTFPVSTDSINTNILGAIKPTMARMRYTFFILSFL